MKEPSIALTVALQTRLPAALMTVTPRELSACEVHAVERQLVRPIMLVEATMLATKHPTRGRITVRRLLPPAGSTRTGCLPTVL